MRQKELGFSASLKRGMAKVDIDDLSGALSDYQSLLKSDPRNQIVLNNLASVYLELGNARKAIQNLKQSLRWAPSHAPSHLTMARAYMLLGELERASGYAQAAIELQPTISTAYALSGQIAFSLRDPETAKAYLQQAIKIGNNDVAIREVFAYV